MVGGEQSQIVSLRAQLAEAQYNLHQTIIRAPSDGYVTQVLIRPCSDGVLAVVELDPDAAVDALPDGVFAQVAVYSDHFSHVSVMRKLLLRMTSWVHYLYLDH